MEKQDKKTIPCDLCEVFNPHQDLLSILRGDILEEKIVYDLAELFKTIGDSTRIKILYALKERELCVCDLSELLEMTSSAISHQLRVLRTQKLVKFRKEGRSVYYSLDDEHVLSLFGQGLLHVTEDRK